jgi:hypothetical protein
MTVARHIPDLSPKDWLRFRTKVSLGDGCWEWTGARSRSGYGYFGMGGHAAYRSARVAYESEIGPIPVGLELDHLCRNRACVRPEHLEPVTNRVNTLRGFGITGVNAAKTHCIKGHPFDEANTYRYPDGGRECRRCRKEWVAAQGMA